MKITQQRATELKKKIEFYRGRKENNIFDTFYHADLDIFVALIDANTLTPEEEQALKDEEERLRLEKEERSRQENARLVAQALSRHATDVSEVRLPAPTVESIPPKQTLSF